MNCGSFFQNRFPAIPTVFGVFRESERRRISGPVSAESHPAPALRDGTGILSVIRYCMEGLRRAAGSFGSGWRRRRRSGKDRSRNHPPGRSWGCTGIRRRIPGRAKPSGNFMRGIRTICRKFLRRGNGRTYGWRHLQISSSIKAGAQTRGRRQNRPLRRDAASARTMRRSFCPFCGRRGSRRGIQRAPCPAKGRPTPGWKSGRAGTGEDLIPPTTAGRMRLIWSLRWGGTPGTAG